jgi:hypothetical protein
MVTFEWIIVLLFGAALLAALARKVGAPYPTFLAVAAAASGGATMAPSAIATGHDISGTSQFATSATASPN